MRPRGRATGRILDGARAAALAVLLAGCTTFPPPAPISEVGVIAGQWRGTIQFGRGPYEFFYLTVNPDGGIVAWWGSTTRWGHVALGGSRARFALYLWSGDLEYFEGAGRRLITLREDFDGFNAQATPLR